MSLTGALQIGQSALSASQLAVQIAGQNIANVGTPGYSRQVISLAPSAGDPRTLSGAAGRGVSVEGVRRQVDEALRSRFLGGLSAEAAAREQMQILSQVEAALQELGDRDLSGELSAFFNAWSERANLTESSAMVVQQGERLATFIRRLRADLATQRTQMDRQLTGAVQRADGLLREIAQVNAQVVRAEGGGAGQANALRDQRDILVNELAGLLDATVIERAGGGIDILVGSTPILLGGSARGLQLERRNVDGELVVEITLGDTGQAITPESGRLGSLLAQRSRAVNATIDALDSTASQLIFQVNRLHSTGSNRAGLTAAAGTLGFAAADRTRALNDPANTAASRLPFAAVNGGFLVHVRNTSTGAEQTLRIDVDLDGRTASGAAGFADDTTAEDIRAALDAAPGLSASFEPSGALRLRAADGFEFSFSEDSSGVLAVLGVNSYFTGANASDIAVRADLTAQPSLLAAGRRVGGVFVENGTAMEMAALQDRTLASLSGESIPGAWSAAVQGLAVRASAAASAAESTRLVRENLEAQSAAASGVSLDEEAMNLLNAQRAYQGAARLISIVDELTQTLMNLV